MLDQRLHQLLKQKMSLLYRLLIILFVTYFFLPIALAFFPAFMNQVIYAGGPSIAWVYTFLQIPLTWLLAWVYWHKAKQFDQRVQEIL